ncbi:MAG: DUF4981 domain-containing protein, partial [Bacteroidales bacterium]|jgi:beta-galactosidase|nr:DUF4981 domain-containing protein [Bacteroidales bacterium]
VPVTGKIRNTPFPVNIGRNAEIHGQETSVYLCDALIDQVGIFSDAIGYKVLAAPGTAIKSKAVLWLDFERIEEGGDFFSYGIGARTYGSIWPDRRPQPEMWQIKKSGQPVSVRLLSAERGELEIINRHLFTNLKEYDTEWSFYCDGELLGKGIVSADIPPLKSGKLVIPLKKPDIKEGAEYRLFISFRLKEKTLWAGKGFEIAWEEMDLPWYWPVEPVPPEKMSPGLDFDINAGKVSGKDFTYTFDKKSGRLASMLFSGRELLRSGPALNVWRAPLANETDEWGFWSSNSRHRTDGYGRMPATEWYSAGLDRLTRVNELFRMSKNESGNAVVEIRNIILLGTGRGAFFDNYIYTIDPAGEIVIDHSVIPNGDMPSWLPRTGVQLTLPSSCSNVKWYGRGPQENYPDRKTGYKTGIYTSTVAGMYEPYLIPQDYGLRCDNRWVRITDKAGNGLEIKGDRLFNFSAQNFSTDNLTKALYTYQLHESDCVTLNIDYATSGVGCTALSVFTEYQVMPRRYDFRLTVRPLKP